MAYKVIKMFTDLKDGGHRYNVGDPYPRKGAEATAERLAELSGRNNKQGEPLISEVKESKPKKVDVASQATSTEDVVSEVTPEKPTPKRGRGKKKDE